MNSFKSKLITTILTVASIASLGTAAFAEGSRDLIEVTHEYADAPAYRPYLEWRDRLQAGGLESKNVIYVYAQRGETVYFGSSVESASDKSIRSVFGEDVLNSAYFNIPEGCQGGTIAVTTPTFDGSAEAALPPKWGAMQEGKNIEALTAGSQDVFLFRPDGNKGIIENTDQEKAGPSALTNGGYEPLSFVAPITGTYSFRFLSSDFSYRDIPFKHLPEGIVIPEVNEATKGEEYIGFDDVTISKDKNTVIPNDTVGDITVYSRGSKGYVEEFSIGGGYNKPNADGSYSWMFAQKGIKFSRVTRYEYDNVTPMACAVSLNAPTVPSKLVVYWSTPVKEGNQNSVIEEIRISQDGYLLGTGRYSGNGVKRLEVPVLQANKPIIIEGDAGIMIYGMEYIYDKDYYDASNVQWNKGGMAKVDAFGASINNGTTYKKTTTLPTYNNTIGDITLYAIDAKAMKVNAITPPEQFEDGKSFSKCIYTGGGGTWLTQNLEPERGIVSITPTVNTASKMKIYWKNMDNAKARSLTAYRNGVSIGSQQLSASTAGIAEISVPAVDEATPIFISGGTGMNIYVIEYDYKDSAVKKPSAVVEGLEAVTKEYNESFVMADNAMAADTTDDRNAAKAKMEAALTYADIQNTPKKDGDEKYKFDNAAITDAETYAPNKYFKYTAPANGTLSLDLVSNTDNYTYVYVTNTPTVDMAAANHVFTKKGETKELTVAVKKNKPVYIYHLVRDANGNTVDSNGKTIAASMSYKSISYSGKDNGDEGMELLARKVDEPWANSPSLVAAWDVTVANGGVEQTGRAWADKLSLNAGNHARSIYSNLFVLTRDGYEYRFNMNGLQPYNFSFYSNTRGFLLDRFNEYTDDNSKVSGLQSFAHSYFSYSPDDAVGAAPTRIETDSNGSPVLIGGRRQITSILPNYTPTDPTKDFNHRLFFNEVEDGTADKPNPVIAAYTINNRDNNGMLISDTNMPSMTDIAAIVPYYEGLGSAAENTYSTTQTSTGTEGVGGNFKFTITTNEGAADAEKGIYYIPADKLE